VRGHHRGARPNVEKAGFLDPIADKLRAQPLLRITGFGYNEAATEDAYRRVFAFFNEHLTPAPQA
jgi:dienelactone hydrolase